MVTDPVDGRLLGSGTTSYLPGPLRRYVLPRDGGCRSPVCTVASPLACSSTTPTPPRRPVEHHQHRWAVRHRPPTKTEGHLTITDSRPDGSCTWTTALGQARHIPPRPFLHDPHDTGPPDPPPF